MAATEELGNAQGVVLELLEGLVGRRDGPKLTIVAVADHDQVPFLATRIERFVIVTWERTVFQIVSQMCISSCCGCQQEGHSDAAEVRFSGKCEFHSRDETQ